MAKADGAADKDKPSTDDDGFPVVDPEYRGPVQPRLPPAQRPAALQLQPAPVPLQGAQDAVEAPVRLAVPGARRQRATQPARLPQDHQETHGPGYYQEADREPVVSLRQRLHRRLPNFIYKLLYVQ